MLQNTGPIRPILLHVADVTEGFSSFGGTINSSLPRLHVGPPLPASSIPPPTSQAYLNRPSSSRNADARTTLSRDVLQRLLAFPSQSATLGSVTGDLADVSIQCGCESKEY